MKRILFCILLAVACTAASAQMNSQVDSLLNEVKEILGPKHIKHFLTRQQLYDHIGTAFRESIWIGRGQHGTDLDKRMTKAIELIRRRLDNLAENSTESYRYEYHKKGIDTIQYAINLSGENTELMKYHNMVDFGSSEDVTFTYYTDKSGRFSNGALYYSLRLNDLRETADSSAWRYGYFDPDDSFRHEDFNKMIARLMNRKGVKRREIHWKNPMPGANKDNAEEKYYMWGQFDNERSKGETNGVVFSVPVKNAELAADILRQLNDSIHGFFDKNPLQVYTFYRDKDFTQNHCERVLFAQYETDRNCYEGLYHVYIVQDASAYHFLFLDTRGSLWIPRKF